MTSQEEEGENNQIADTGHFQNCSATQIDFSWVTFVLQTTELSLTVKKKGPRRTVTACGGAAGNKASTKKRGTLTPSSLLYPHEQDICAKSFIQCYRTTGWIVTGESK
jgi:hypothetical protein